jgi:ERCC4-type nuclease
MAGIFAQYKIINDKVPSILLDDRSLELHQLPAGEVQLKRPQFVLFVDTREKGGYSGEIIRPENLCDIMLKLNVWAVPCELPVGDYIFAEFDAEAAANYEQPDDCSSDDDADDGDSDASPVLYSSSNAKKRLAKSAPAPRKASKTMNTVNKIPPYYRIHCVIERKALPDLVSSTMSGHRADQRQNMLDHSIPNCVWLVTGDTTDLDCNHLRIFEGVRNKEVFSHDGLDKSCKTAFLHLENDAEVPVLLKAGIKHTAASILQRRKASVDNSGAVHSYMHTLKKNNATAEQRYCNAVTLLSDKFGASRAAALQTEFPSLADLFSACLAAVSNPSARRSLVERIAAIEARPVGVQTSRGQKIGEKRATKLVTDLMVGHSRIPLKASNSVPRLVVPKCKSGAFDEDDDDDDGNCSNNSASDDDD